MNMQAGLEKCPPIISSEFKPWISEAPVCRPAALPLSITISRQSGAGAHVIANRLAEYLHFCAPDPSLSWNVFDRNLVAQVLEDHHLPARFARFMPEDRVSETADVLDELLGTHPPSRVLVQQTCETILRLAQRGHAILIGRGANLITRDLNSVFHVRLVGSLDRRAVRIQKRFGLSKTAAIELIQREDKGRQRYVKKYFDNDVDDARQYHLVINTDLLDDDETARFIGATALGHVLKM